MGYWLAVDEHDVVLTNGIGDINLDESAEHVLVWWMVGNPGDAISIEGTQAQKSVVSVKNSRIPNNTSKGAGYRRFKI